MQPSKLIPGDFLLSQGPASQVPSALKSLTSVFGMGTGVASSLKPPGNFISFSLHCSLKTTQHISFQLLKTVSRSSPRPISTSQLRTLLLFHTWPIYQLISLESYQLNAVGNLILRRVSRLDAFSAYPCRS